MEEEKVGRSYIRWIQWLFEDIRWVFDQKFVHNDGLVRWSFGTTMVRIDSWDTEISTPISLKVKWRFSVTISFTLAMLSWVEDVVPLVMQNLRQILCSIFFSLGKIAKHTWDKLTTSSTVNKLNGRSRSNSTSVYTQNLFISIFTIVFFNLGKNVSLWEFLAVKILNFRRMIKFFQIAVGSCCGRFVCKNFYVFRFICYPFFYSQWTLMIFSIRDPAYWTTSFWISSYEISFSILW